MSSSDIAISVRDLGKTYFLTSAVKHTTLGEKLLATMRNPLARPKTESFEALRGVNFEVKKGEVVGIIGRNGAGKSTLLKVLSRITQPTRGRIELRGRVGSLLEVGTGFHQELSGRENIYLNGAILGMRRQEIDRQFDAMVDFAGVEKFLDTPVKRYSSGMYVRLAFAVAAHLSPEILIIDEVLAVGDSEFQQKCLGKMKDAASGGRTVLFVSHNMQAINLLCDRGIFLKGGQVVTDDTADVAVAHYIESFVAGGDNDSNATRRRGSGEYRLLDVKPIQPVFDPGEPVKVDFRVVHQRGEIGSMYLSAHLVDELGAIVAQCDSRLVGVWLNDLRESRGRFEIRTPWLKPGTYRLDLFLCTGEGSVDFFENATSINVSPVWPYPHTVSADGVGKGCVLADFHWSLDRGVKEPAGVN